MANSLVINAMPAETRVALLEDRQPVEVHIERTTDRGAVGNIYRGKVVRVLPGMQAAFVEVGLPRTAFLYVNDAVLGPPGEADDPSDEARPRRPRSQPVAEIADVLREGEEILVQVQKEALGTKGARLSRHLTLPGRYLVYMPFNAHVGVSHRIESEAERERLREVLLDPKRTGGFIVRTAAEGIERDALLREVELLTSMWRQIEARGASLRAPALVFEDLDLALRATRDLFVGEVQSVVVDDPTVAEKIRAFVAGFSPADAARVSLFDKPEPIFDHFGIEAEIDRALQRRVWLKSGGYLVFDQAEALTVVDVNSGRFVGRTSLEETITQINLEAVREVAFQLRLRNIGGIIIIDFIDMAEGHNRQKVLSGLEEALARDKVRTTIVRMSELGLVEMTRKRVRDSLGEALTEACPTCEGRGAVKSRETVANEVLRAIVRSLAEAHTPRMLINMEPELCDHLYETTGDQIQELERRHATQIIPVAREGYHRERWRIVRSSGGSRADE